MKWNEIEIYIYHGSKHINRLRLRQNGRRFADDTFIRIFF